MGYYSVADIVGLSSFV